MTSTGTTAFNPAASDLVLNAFSKYGLSSAVLTAEHLQRAYIESNLLNIEFSNRGVNLWKSETIQVPPAATLTPGTQTYVMPATTIAVIIVYIETLSGQNTTDRILGPLSTYEYQAMPNKLKQGPPTSFWFDRQITPSLTFWPVPDAGGPYTALCRVLQQIQDTSLAGGATLDLPWRFLAAYEAGLAFKLAMHFAPQRAGQRSRRGLPATGLACEYEVAWEDATTRGAETVNITIMPNIGRYYR